MRDEIKLFLIVFKERFELSLNENLNEDPILTIKETDYVYFEIQSPKKLLHPVLWIHDLALIPNLEDKNENGVFIYIWRPVEKPFINHFGRCLISLQYTYSENDVTEKILYSIIDILALKFKADQVKSMLFFLESRMDDVIQSCFSRTYWKTNSNHEGVRHSRVILQVAESCLGKIEINLSRFRHRPISRLSPETKIIQPTQIDSIDISSIEWLFHNPEKLTLLKSTNDSSVIIHKKNFGLEEFIGENLFEDTNTYENQAVRGFIESILETIQGIKSKFKQLNKELEEGYSIGNIPQNFSSFEEIVKIFGKTFYESQIEKCEKLQRRCLNCLNFWKIYVPTNKSITSMPNFTPKFSSYSHYEAIFIKMIDWYNLGKVNIEGEKYLFSLRTLDKLYEFYFLFLLIDALKTLGFSLVSHKWTKESENIVEVEQANPANSFLFTDYKNYFKLEYEPRINLSSENEEDLIYVFSGYNQQYPFLEPDFLVSIFNDEEMKYIIFDCKYMKPSDAIRQALPKLTQKYIHSLSTNKGGISPVKVLLAIHPKNIDSNYRGVYMYSNVRKGFDINSKTPIIPALGTLEITPENHEINISGLSERLQEIFSIVLNNNN